MFAGPDAEIKSFYSDNANELRDAAKSVKWFHATNTPFVSCTNGRLSDVYSTSRRGRVPSSRVLGSRIVGGRTPVVISAMRVTFAKETTSRPVHGRPAMALRSVAC